MLSVQSLSICLSIALVVFTGVIVGGLSISTGDRLLADCRAGGDAAVGMSIDSSDKDIRQMAMRYLGRVTGSVEERIAGFFASGERILDLAAELGRTMPPEDMTGRGERGMEYLNTTIRSHLASVLRTNNKHGIDMTMWRWGDGTGEMVFYRMGTPMAVPKRDGTPTFGLVQSQTVAGEFAENGQLVATGEIDAKGWMANRDLPCWIYRANLTEMPVADLDRIQMGQCILPRQYFYFVPHITQSEYWMLRNAKLPESPATQLAPANKVVFSPMYSYFHWQTMQAHIAITHPDMPNDLGPRQGNRVGYFSISMSGEKVSDIFATTAVPAGSVLYCVERDPWTGEVGNLLATNHGRLTGWTKLYPPGGKVPYPFRVPLKVWNHTMTENDTAVSVIGQHSTYVRGRGGFESVANATRDEFIEWVGEDGTTYWFTVLHMQFANLNWYISLLVPRSSIMDRMDASVEAIRAANAATRREADADQKESLMITLVVTAVVAAVLMAASVLMTKMILSPIVKLGDDMASVATMKVESVDLDGELSSLSEVHRMQESFRTMVRNLIEYKQYMPQAVLLDSGDEDAMDSEGSAKSVFSLNISGSSNTSQVASGQRSSGSRPVSRATAAHSGPARAQASRLTDTSLKTRSVTVVCYNVRGWLQIAAGMGDREFQRFCGDVTAALQRCIAAGKGVADVFAGDHFLVAHNAFTTQATHRAAALRTALQVAKAVAGVRLPSSAVWPKGMAHATVSYAACSGEAKVGQMGCAGMKKVTIHSSVTPFAVALERYNKTRGYRGVADHFCAKDVFPHFELRRTDDVQFDKRMNGMTVMDLSVYEVMETKQVGNEEWMYQLERAKTDSPYASWNRVFDLIAERDWAAAREVLENHTEDVVVPSEMDRVRDILAQETFRPVELM